MNREMYEYNGIYASSRGTVACIYIIEVYIIGSSCDVI